MYNNKISICFFQSQMLHLFDEGQRRDFFELWQDMVPENIRTADNTAQKLEFNLNIYFAIYHIKYNSEVRVPML